MQTFHNLNGMHVLLKCDDSVKMPVFTQGIKLYEKHAKNIKTIAHYLTTLNILPETFKRFTRLAANALPSIILKYSNLNESTVFEGALSDLETDAKLTSSVEGLGSELSNPGCSTLNIFKPVQKVERALLAGFEATNVTCNYF